MGGWFIRNLLVGLNNNKNKQTTVSFLWRRKVTDFYWSQKAQHCCMPHCNEILFVCVKVDHSQGVGPHDMSWKLFMLFMFLVTVALHFFLHINFMTENLSFALWIKWWCKHAGTSPDASMNATGESVGFLYCKTVNFDVPLVCPIVVMGQWTQVLITWINSFGCHSYTWFFFFFYQTLHHKFFLKGGCLETASLNWCIAHALPPSGKKTVKEGINWGAFQEQLVLL